SGHLLARLRKRSFLPEGYAANYGTFRPGPAQGSRLSHNLPRKPLKTPTRDCNSRDCSHIKCGPDPSEQQVMIERLCKELDCTLSHRSNSNPGISMSRDEDDRDIAFLFFK